VGQFLQHLAQTESDPVRALAASRDAIALLYRDVLHIGRRNKLRPVFFFRELKWARFDAVGRAN
jgi:hypothetical protein